MYVYIYIYICCQTLLAPATAPIGDWPSQVLESEEKTKNMNTKDLIQKKFNDTT